MQSVTDGHCVLLLLLQSSSAVTPVIFITLQARLNLSTPGHHIILHKLLRVKLWFHAGLLAYLASEQNHENLNEDRCNAFSGKNLFQVI